TRPSAARAPGTWASVLSCPSDDVRLGAASPRAGGGLGPPAAEPSRVEPRHVDARGAARVQVAHDLADGRCLEEPVAREAGRVQHAAGYVAGLADEGVAVGGRLV